MKAPDKLPEELFKPDLHGYPNPWSDSDKRLMVSQSDGYRYLILRGANSNADTRGKALVSLKGGVLLDSGRIAYTDVVTRGIPRCAQSEQSEVSYSCEDTLEINLTEQTFEWASGTWEKEGNGTNPTAPEFETEHSFYSHDSGSYGAIPVSFPQSIWESVKAHDLSAPDDEVALPQNFKTCASCRWLVGTNGQLSPTRYRYEVRWFDSNVRGPARANGSLTEREEVSGVVFCWRGPRGTTRRVYFRGTSSPSTSLSTVCEISIFENANPLQEFMTVDDETDGVMPEWRNVARQTITVKAGQDTNIAVPFDIVAGNVYLVVARIVGGDVGEETVEEPIFGSTDGVYNNENGRLEGETEGRIERTSQWHVIIDDWFISPSSTGTYEEMLEQPW